MELVSVVIPCYNSGATIEKTIESLNDGLPKVQKLTAQILSGSSVEKPSGQEFQQVEPPNVSGANSGIIEKVLRLHLIHVLS